MSGYYYTATDNYDIKWTMPHCVLTLKLIGKCHQSRKYLLLTLILLFYHELLHVVQMLCPFSLQLRSADIQAKDGCPTIWTNRTVMGRYSTVPLVSGRSTPDEIDPKGAFIQRIFQCGKSVVESASEIHTECHTHEPIKVVSLCPVTYHDYGLMSMAYHLHASCLMHDMV